MVRFQMLLSLSRWEKHSPCRHPPSQPSSHPGLVYDSMGICLQLSKRIRVQRERDIYIYIYILCVYFTINMCVSVCMNACMHVGRYASMYG